VVGTARRLLSKLCRSVDLVVQFADRSGDIAELGTVDNRVSDCMNEIRIVNCCASVRQPS
jgi:hypothetical protein